jgi:hypothetical protein
MLLLRLSGAFLLRMAERAFLELLFQEPPRSTRTITARCPSYRVRVLMPIETAKSKILTRAPLRGEDKKE